MSEAQTDDDGASIAIIGMAGRFPGARTPEQFWTNLANGHEAVRFFDDEELLAAGEAPHTLEDPNYVKAWPVLEGVADFDAGFFGMSPRDAAVMDPQHRIFLQVAWHALENAGYAPEGTPASTAVFAACGMNTYMMHHLVRNAEVMETVGEWLIRHTGNDMNFLATRVSYQLNLKGPSLNVQTACSSALVAVHQACQSLLNGECDLALAGATTLSLPQDRGYLYREGEILARDGHCRPFDAAAGGTLFGSGAGCVVLKRLADALADGDHVVGVIRGSAINNDGSAKVGYLAPSVEGQARAVAEALSISGVDPETISYVEAHGTGTAVGDPIEVTALTQAYRHHTTKRAFCALGSVKGNIGHLGEAAGMAGLLKVLLAMRHRQLPPSINYSRPNPEIDFEKSPFFVNTKLADWSPGSGRRRAGITALGAGGTNAHLILEEAPAQPPRSQRARPELLVLSARSPAALDAATQRLAAHLRENPQLDLSDVARTLQQGRRAFTHRRVCVASDTASAVAVLESGDAKRLPSQAARRTVPQVVFMFPGGGAQYAGMGADLYEQEPAYRQALDSCLASLPAELSARVRRLVLERGAGQAAAGTELERPSLALPALFATEYAMAKLLMSWQLAPVACIGHSMGEYVAACLAGVFSIADGMSLVAARGRLFETLPEGGMLSVALSEQELLPLLGAELSIAAVNAPKVCAASGPVAAIEALRQRLTEREIDNQRVHISVAAHSAMLEPILAEFEQICRRVRLSPPSLPFVSNLTGTWITPAEATDPTYWVRHLRSTVRFASGVAEILSGGERVLLEVGPGRTLSSLARLHGSAPVAQPTLRHPQEQVPDAEFLLMALGKLWLSGTELPWQQLAAPEARRVPLPGYPFEERPYWIEPDRQAAQQAHHGPLRKQPEMSDWFFAAGFQRAASTGNKAEGATWLVFDDEAGLCSSLLTATGGARLVRVTLGESFVKYEDEHYSMRIDAPIDYESLIADLALRGLSPTRIVYAWPLTPPRISWSRRVLQDNGAFAALQRAEKTCFLGLLYLAQALGAQELSTSLLVVSSGLHGFEAPRAQPEKALLLGPLRVIPREFPGILTRSIDVALPLDGNDADIKAALLDELLRESDQQAVLLRRSGRWAQNFEHLPLPAAPAEAPVFRAGGVFLITGGLGGIGLVLAEHLAKVAQAKLVLVGRTGLPERSQWPQLVAAGDPVTRRIRQVQAIESLGSEVLVVGADVTSPSEMRQVVEQACERFGTIHGVVHSAGLIDDGLISLKTAEAAARVMSVKTRGALALDAALRGIELDFFVVFSSISSVLGLEGQVDYTAANAFLDAFAEERAASGKGRTVSVGWNAWRDIGMAVSLAEQPEAIALAGASSHPCLERVLQAGAERTTFVTSFSRTKHWLLSEHVTRSGTALIPGTGYLELARAGFMYRPEPGTLELRDVTFLEPFQVGVGESRELRLELGAKADGEREFRFFSDAEDRPHVTGRGRFGQLATPAPQSLAELAARCREREQRFDGFLDQPFMAFGPRWANVERIGYGQGEALIRLRLPEAFSTDLAAFALHPALLDMATGGAQALLAGFDKARDFFVPFAYGRVALFAPLTPRLVSHVKLRPSNAADIAVFDVTLLDETGRVLVSIENFTMRRIESEATLAAARAGAEPAARSSRLDSRIGAAVRLGIGNDEGTQALERILCSPLNGAVIASSVDLHAWLADVRAKAEPPSRVGSTGDGASEEAGSERAALGREFVAPRNDVERDLAAIWRELLGIVQVGVHDDFFEVGGTSLVAVRLFNKIRKKWGVSLPLSTLFEAPNIEGCAKIIAEDLGLSLSYDAEPPGGADASSEAALTNGASSLSADPPPSRDVPPASARLSAKKTRWPTLVTMQGRGSLPPFFCMAGLGGNLNNLRKLAILAGDDRPVFGLQPPGADDPSKLIYSVPELAEHYLSEVKAVQAHGPYFLGGYSGGGITAFEMCRRLLEEGEQVAFLGLIDSYSPELPERSKLERAQIHWQRLSNIGPQYLVQTLERRASYEQYELRRRVSRRLRQYFPGHFKFEQMEDSWLVAQAAYKPPPLDFRATLFRAREIGSMSLWTAFKDDEQHGWGRYLVGGVDVKLCPGNHNTMCEEPNVRVLAAHLRESMARAASEPASSKVAE